MASRLSGYISGQPPGKLLFLDRFHIDKLRGLEFQMHQPVKSERNPILRPEKPWEGWRSFPYGRCILRDPADGLLKMWYETQHDGPLSGRWESPAIKRTAYATSTDGIHWHRPLLGQVVRDGSSANSLIDMGPFGVHCANVVLDEDHDPDPARRFKMMFYAIPSGQGNGIPRGVNVAVSADGMRWSLPLGPRKTAFYDESGYVPRRVAALDVVSLVGWVEEPGRYVAYVKSCDLFPRGFRTICYTESIDFHSWTPPVSVLAPDEYDPSGTEFYYMTVFPYAGLYLGLLCVYHNLSRRPNAWQPPTASCPPELAPLDQRLQVRLAYSRDLQVWYQAGGRAAFLPVGEPGTWDSGMVFGSTLIENEDEILIYYGGSPLRHVADDLVHAGECIDGQTWGIFGGVARLRRDGFVGLSGGAEPGEAVTRPVLLTGRPLAINARTCDGGRLTVQLLDEAGSAIPGVPVTVFQGDALSAVLNVPPVTLSALAGQRARFHIACQEAELFSIEL